LYVWKERSLRVSLDSSFSFLREKYTEVVPSWVAGHAPEAAFAAGYVDAEGSFHQWCGRIGVVATIGRTAVAGTRKQVSLNRDVWRVNVNERHSLLRLIATLEPYLRHARRVAAANEARTNVIDRLRRDVAADGD
jgi:hypothetical protein